MIHSKKVISVAVLLFCALCVFAQAFRIDLNNVTVRRAMTELRQKSGYSFVFETSDLNTNQRVSVNADNLQDAIRQILNGQDVCR